MSGLVVRQPGLLSLIQDGGRFGAHKLGLTTGGPLDRNAFDWANRLLGNQANSSVVEISFGGLVLESFVDTSAVITGAAMSCKLNGKPVDNWVTFDVKKGDLLEFGFASSGVRAYLAVAGGFNIPPTFGSTSTVVREKIGGLNGNKLKVSDTLSCKPDTITQHCYLDTKDQPEYSKTANLRMILGYQHKAFNSIQQLRFFNATYRVTERSDRMGFRLEGAVIHSDMVGMLSEGICHGAIQIPADGQPIVLMNDRQTIGGYPKIGSVIPQDTARLSQLSPGSEIRFESISLEYAHNLHWLDKARFQNTKPLKR